MVLEFKYGLNYKERLYVWHNKRLYRYPFDNGKMYFGLKEIEPKNNQYRLCRDWVTIGKIQSLTTLVKVEPISIIKDEVHLPF